MQGAISVSQFSPAMHIIVRDHIKICVSKSHKHYILCVISCWSHELGDKTDTETSFSPSGRMIFARFCQYSWPVETFPYLFPQHMALTGSCLQFPAIVKSFAVLWDRKQANRKCVKCPVPTPAQARAFYYPKSCGFFQKDDSTNTRQFALRLSILICFVK